MIGENHDFWEIMTYHDGAGENSRKFEKVLEQKRRVF